MGDPLSPQPRLSKLRGDTMPKRLQAAQLITFIPLRDFVDAAARVFSTPKATSDKQLAEFQKSIAKPKSKVAKPKK